MGTKSSGRPSDKSKYEISKKLKPLEQKWINALERGIEGGDAMCIRIYADYSFGKPVQQTELSGPDGGAIQIGQIKGIVIQNDDMNDVEFQLQGEQKAIGELEGLE